MRLFNAFALSFVLTSASAVAQTADKTIVPGERIGPASIAMSLDQMVQVLGPKQALGRPNNGQAVLQQPETSEAQASAVHRFDHAGIRVVTAAGADRVGLVATYNSTDADHGYATKEGVRIGSARSDVEAAYGRATAVLGSNPAQVQMIYDDRGLGLRLTAENRVDLIQVFRPGAGRDRWKF